MFYSIREDRFDEFRYSWHSVWREDFKIAENLSFENSFKILAAQMLDYDTMQVKTLAETWFPTIWTGLEVKKHYASTVYNYDAYV